MDVVNRLWLQGGFRFLDHDIFRISAFATVGAIRDNIDLVAFLELGHSRTYCFDDTGNIPARNVRQGKRKDILQVACSRFPVDRIYRAAWTFINNSPDSGVGRGASSKRSTSGPP